MIELHLRGRVAAGRRADLARFLAEAIPFYERPGGIRVRVLWDLTDPDRFIEIIEYADQGTHDRDQLRVQSDSEMLEVLGRWRELLAGPPQVETYRVDTAPTPAKPQLCALNGPHNAHNCGFAGSAGST